MVKERKPLRGYTPSMVMVDESAFTQHVGMFDQKARKRALTDINNLLGDSRQLLGSAMAALLAVQSAVKARKEGFDIKGALELANQISADTLTFKGRLDVIAGKIPTTPSDEAVLATLHIATELQQWSEDWANVAQPMIDNAIKLMESSQ